VVRFAISDNAFFAIHCLIKTSEALLPVQDH